MWLKPIETPKEKRFRIVLSTLWASLIIWAIIPGSTVIYKAEAEAPQVVEVKIETKEQMLELVKETAVKYGVSATLMTKIISCENPAWLPTQQSNMRYKKDNPKWGVKAGDREESYGLAQIHVVDNNVTISQATDPKFAIEFVGKTLKENGTWPWNGSKYCWSK